MIIYGVMYGHYINTLRACSIILGEWSICEENLKLHISHLGHNKQIGSFKKRSWGVQPYWWYHHPRPRMLCVCATLNHTMHILRTWLLPKVQVDTKHPLYKSWVIQGESTCNGWCRRSDHNMQLCTSLQPTLRILFISFRHAWLCLKRYLTQHNR